MSPTQTALRTPVSQARFDRVGRVGVGVVDDRGGLPPAGADPAQTEPAHRLRDRLAGDGLAVLAQVGQDPWGTGDLVGVAVEPGDLGLDPLGAQSPASTAPAAARRRTPTGIPPAAAPSV